MKLKRLHAQNFRNFHETTLSFHDKLNLFAGENGSGKTSLLEAVYFLGSGRSFRGQKIDPVTRRGESSFLVSGEVVSQQYGVVSLGYQRSDDGERTLRVNGENKHQASELARYLPSLVLGPQTVDLVTGAPTERRNFLNRGVFHVEQSFGEIWAHGVRSLRQRNALLKSYVSTAELTPWTEQLVNYAAQIDSMRETFFEEFLPVFDETYRFLLRLEGVKCAYRRGWDSSKPLGDVYKEQLDSDRQRGFTFSGFQRADLRFTIDGKSVVDTCSRGELKLIAWAAVLAQGRLLGKQEETTPIYLVDDLIAELDEKHQRAIAQILDDIGGQVLVTGTDSDRLQALWDKASLKMFHVKQGSISEVETAR